MPAWFGKKSSSNTKSKDQNQHQIHHQDNNNPFFSNTYNNHHKKHSFDSPRVSSSSTPVAGGHGSGFGFAGFDSDRVAHPLPQPSISPTTSLPSISPTTSLPSISPTTSLPSLGVTDNNHGSGGSVSSSGGSSVSSADDPNINNNINFDQAQLGGFFSEKHSTTQDSTKNHGGRTLAGHNFKVIRGSNVVSFTDVGRVGENVTDNVMAESKFSPRARSPCPGSRVGTTATSPLHPRFATSTSLDSPNKKTDDGKSECHPLPLPPSSPTSPSSALSSNKTCSSPTSPSSVLSNMKTLSVMESPKSQPSKWKKGRLLSRHIEDMIYPRESGQMCGIKEVRVVADDSSSKECLKQLNQEITLLSQLSHPNIVQYYGSELGEETLSVYLEYVSGGSIHKLLQEYGAFREPVIQNYTRQVLSGLAYLHGRKTVHRDIKGANILVDPNGEIKLADFGMAKHITNCTNMLSFKGSPYWMAPEVVMNTNGYNLAVDIWSLGCTILEMATSKPPWGQYEGVAAIFKIGNSKDMPEIPEHLSNDAKSFIKLCLQRDPCLRPPASKLLDHPFVRDQATSRGANVSLTKEAFPFTFDGSRTPTASEMHSNRTNMNSFEGTVAASSRGAMLSPRRNTRTNTSLPVSPTASPMRQYGSPAYRSCYASPPHPSYTMIGQSQNNYNLNDGFALPSRPNAKTTLDPWYETPQLEDQSIRILLMDGRDNRNSGGNSFQASPNQVYSSPLASDLLAGQ
ncbi:mitogen-activated protein kinase kinase kinase 3 [Tanacetum coccineum]|uniref:Mitogen-activated protein kinase kinase kinase 3 n=1 Tax=Tanacetum coccineum TaxID=301880 RepID=A0ABQ4Y0Q0_9ASTR